MESPNEYAGALNRVKKAHCHPGRRKEERDSSSLEQHPIRLVAGKILCCAHKRQKADQAND
jgi:hypothetical protein